MKLRIMKNCDSILYAKYHMKKPDMKSRLYTKSIPQGSKDIHTIVSLCAHILIVLIAICLIYK